MKTIINTARALSLGAAFCLAACTDDYVCNLFVEEPTDAELAAELAQYDVLKTYAAGQLPLGAAMSTSAWGNKDVAYSALVDNFTAVDVNGSFGPLALYNVTSDAYDFTPIATMADDAAAAGLDVYGGALVAATGQRKAYYESLVAPIVIPVKPEKGKTKITDFEDVELGTAYPMTGNSQAVIDTDPDGKSGHVLHVGTNATGANWSWAKVHVTLPEGRKLGDYVRINFDLKHLNNGQGQYGGGMKLLINGTQIDLGINAAGLGAGSKWVRGAVIDLTGGATKPACTLPEDMKALTEFDLSIGSGSGSAQYVLDNLSMEYEVKAQNVFEIVGDFDTVGELAGTDSGGSSSIVADPEGKRGNVAKFTCGGIGLPKYKVKLPKGMTLGDVTGVKLDMKMLRYSGGFQGPFFKFFDPATGAQLGGDIQVHDFPHVSAEGPWEEYTETIALGNIMPDNAKNLSEVVFEIGAISWSGHDFYVDNIQFAHASTGKVIEKTPEEMNDIFTAEMKSLVAGMIAGGVGETGAVKSWDLVTEPLAAEDGEDDFSWRKYMGDDGYARIAMRIARDTLAAIPADKQPTLYVEQTLDQNDGSDIVTKASDLLNIVRSWEADGTTRFDGINIRLHAVCSKDASANAANEQAISSMLAALATSGKAVRLSDIAIAATDESGAAIALNTMKHADKLEVAAFMTAIVSAYKATIPASQQGGLVFRTLGGSDSLNTLAPWSSAWSRTEMYEGIVNGLK